MRRVVLGSGSAIRARLLRDAGVTFTVEAPRVNEGMLKRQAWEASPAELAAGLAKAKALEVSRRRPGDLVIGADQTMSCDGKAYDKPTSSQEARARLLELRGRTHQLHAGTALARDGAVVWHDLRTSSLTMRRFSDAFVDDYVARAGEALTATVGGYEYEGLGAQLFDAVEGDFFAVLGLPLLPLLDALRTHGGLPD